MQTLRICEKVENGHTLAEKSSLPLLSLKWLYIICVNQLRKESALIIFILGNSLDMAISDSELKFGANGQENTHLKGTEENKKIGKRT